ncbi:signal peptidase 22kDa subunit [Radiomyces spectabilis]|uniref:signal peptidase 22kDa subunit n=1 Tax=Radiomyces spectabilis TaxID=64574 RepID=UPI00221FB090|nr:signal peptidase 22kDa subunit [Radiomyces spectabilis]KAI8366723.1 signal peptidase 22kDa subunit [Radiomyces spectabilis]
MYNLQQRANVLLSYALTALSCVLGVIALISAIKGYPAVDNNITIDNNLVRIVKRRYGPENYDYGQPKSDFARVAFDLDADFTPFFDWNTKQIFVTVIAEYETKTHNRNSIVLWDRIITRKDDAKLSLKKVSNKYALIDVSRKWTSQQANLSLHWDITPHVGILQGGRSSMSSANFILAPAEASS